MLATQSASGHDQKQTRTAHASDGERHDIARGGDDIGVWLVRLVIGGIGHIRVVVGIARSIGPGLIGARFLARPVLIDPQQLKGAARSAKS